MGVASTDHSGALQAASSGGVHLGDELAWHVLRLARTRGALEVVAVTRCRQFAEASSADPTLTMEAHVAKGTDKGIRFHTDRQAQVVGLVPGYRVADVDNKGIGVLVRYELATLDWPGGLSSAEACRPSVSSRARSLRKMPPPPAGHFLSLENSGHQRAAVGAVVGSLIGSNKEVNFDQPLMDVGIDSFLQSGLAQAPRSSPAISLHPAPPMSTQRRHLRSGAFAIGNAAAARNVSL